jgi:DNA-binding NtrC family response regulator
VVLVGADSCWRDLNADTLRHAGYSVIGLATCEQLITLLAGGTAVDCLVVSEGLKPTNARQLVSEVRSLCPELRTIVWELDRSDGVDQICEAVEQLLVAADP